LALVEAAPRWLAMLLFAALLIAPRLAAAGEVMLVPTPSGRIGAWLALGPINVKGKRGQQRSMDANVLMDADEASMVGKLGRQVTVGSTDADGESNTATWKVLSSSEGPSTSSPP
jgi:hypothetical protein